MDNVFIQSGVIAVFYLIIKFIEMRVVLKENKPLKVLLRDTIIVYVSALVGMYIIDEFMLKGEVTKSFPKAFIDTPTF
jgi:hypothetical protein